MLKAANRAGWIAVGWYVLLALAVLGPLAMPGYLQLLDSPVGPLGPRLTIFPLPSEGAYSAGAPSSIIAQALIALPAELAPSVANQVLIAAAIVVGGAGMHRFAHQTLRLSLTASLASGTLFVINPFIYERLISGQLNITLGLALLPWALPTVMLLAERGSWESTLRSLGWCFLVCLVSTHLGGMLLMFSLLGAALAPVPLPRKTAFAAALVFGLIALNAYWIIPTWATGQNEQTAVGTLETYAPQPRTPAVLTRVLLLHGFWRTEFETPLDNSPGLFLVAIFPLLATAAVGLFVGLPHRRGSTAFNLWAAIALVLGMGTSFTPTAPVTRFLLRQMPGYVLYREPHKWIAIVTLMYAIYLGIGTQHLIRKLSSRAPLLRTGTAAVVLLPLVASAPLLWGFGGQVTTSKFPSGWATVASKIDKVRGSILFFPWHEFLPLTFADDRVIRTPAPLYFRKPIITSNDDNTAMPPNSTEFDPRKGYVTQLLDGRAGHRMFGTLIAPLGVRYLILARLGDWHRYSFLKRQQDLRLVESNADIVLYENLAWRGANYALQTPKRSSSPSDRLSNERLSALALTRLTPWAPSIPGQRSSPSLPMVFGNTRPLPSLDGDFVGTDLSCLDMWQLRASDEAICHLGAMASFRTPASMKELKPALSGIQVLSYLFSAVSAFGLSCMWWSRLARARSRSDTTDGI